MFLWQWLRIRFQGFFFKEKRTVFPLPKWTLWFGTKFPSGILINPSKSFPSSRVNLVGTVSISSGDTSSDTK